VNRQMLTVATLALGLFCSQLAAAPTQGARYAVTGSVIDQTQAFVPKAEVALTDTLRHKKRKTRSDHSGRFKLDGLPPGEYEMEVSRPGFKPARSKVSISERDVERDVYLEIGELSEMVVITQAQVVTPASEIRTSPRGEPPVCEPATERPIGGNIRPPTKIRDVRPVYPRHLKTARIRGHVVVQARVGADGLVSSPMVVLPAREEFADAATDAIVQWLFDPIYLNCQPVPTRLTVDIEFTDGQ